MTSHKLRKIIVRYRGLFDLDALYAAIISWCKDKGYDWHEETYKHKVPTPLGAEFEWYWYAEKEVTDYLKYKIHFRSQAWEMTEAEVVKNGKKKVLSNGRIEIVIQGEMILDWQKKWQKGRFSRFLGRMWERMIRKEIENVYHDNLYYRIWDLQTIMKKFFDMQTKWNEYKKYLKED